MQQSVSWENSKIDEVVAIANCGDEKVSAGASPARLHKKAARLGLH